MVMAKRLSIFVLGNVDDYHDEAQKNITRRLISELEGRHKIQYVNVKENIMNPGFWRALYDFRPDIIHIFLRPTPAVLLYTRILRFIFRRSKIIVSAFQPPTVSNGLKGIIYHLRPDLFITVSESLTTYFRGLHCNSTVLRCGVDTRKFRSANEGMKRKLRVKYQLPVDKYIVLHVGHATRGRNLPILSKLSIEGVQVVFVSSKSFNIESVLVDDLHASGCRVFTDYIASIEEFYQLADCYVFPTEDESYSIGLPLSLLEAMACDKPVVTTGFGALRGLFGEDGGFLYFDGTPEDLKRKIMTIIESHADVSNREKVMEFEWGAAAEKLEDIYKELLYGRS